MELSFLGLLAFQFIGVPYRWGGSDYRGLDCSGLIYVTQRDAGMGLPRLSSQGYYDLLVKKKKMPICKPGEDCLLFFGKDENSITHVALGISEDYMIEAGGAGRNSLEMSEEELAKLDARVRIRKISSRRRAYLASVKLEAP